MQVEVANAPASTELGGETFYFCSDRCRVRFEANPERFIAKGAKPDEPVTPVSVPVTLGRIVHKDEANGHQSGSVAPDSL